MLSLERLRPLRYPARLEQYLNTTSPLILATLIVYFLIRGLTLIPLSNGGTDLVDADIPKSLMLLHGQNPYSTQPWASPYPPLLLLVDSGIIRLTGLFSSQPSSDLISQNLRIAGLFATTLAAFTIFLYLRKHTQNPLTPLISTGLFLTLPALSISPFYFFHSDTFGYPILALSLIALASRRYMIGTSLLATATIFKIHPILAIPLVLIWLARNNGLRNILPSLASTITITTLGLALPTTIPGYTESVLGFNLANTGNGTTLNTLLTSASNLLPPQLQFTPTTVLANQIWITSTLALYTIILGTVWTRARRLGPIDIVLLGLLAWLIPLKIEYTHYVAWAIIPLLMRGQIRQTIPLLGLLQTADALSYWSWWPNTSPISGVDTFTSMLIISLIYRTISIAGLAFVLYSTRQKSPLFSVNRVSEPDRSLDETSRIGEELAPMVS